MESIVSIVQDFNEFFLETNSKDMVLFADWLKKKYSQSGHLVGEREEGTLNLQISNLIGDLGDLHSQLTKIAFTDSDINSLTDIKILRAVGILGNPIKRKLLEQIPGERTTKVESIKRLIKNGYLDEIKDQSRKSSIIISLTSKGDQVLLLIEDRVSKISNVFSNKISLEQKRTLIPLLGEISKLPSFLSQKHSKHEILAIIKNY